VGAHLKGAKLDGVGVDGGAQDPGAAIPAKETRLKIGPFDERRPIAPDARNVRFEVPLEAGSHAVEAAFLGDDGSTRGAYYATIRRLEN
jgi:hypothetical protein